MQYILPNPSIIIKSTKSADMNSISPRAFVGRIISGAWETRKPKPRGRKEGVLLVKSSDMLRIGRIFNRLISF
jgi:hypothetical protein